MFILIVKNILNLLHFYCQQEIGKKLCAKTGSLCRGTCRPAARPEQMKVTVTGDTQWFHPTSEQQVFDAIKQAQGKTHKLVFGNTGFGENEFIY